MITQIILADDHAMLRQGLRSMIEKHAGMHVVAEADNGIATVQLVKKHQPNLVIMDITMPDMNGIDATKEIIETCPHVKVIALSMHSDKKFVTEMLAAGASGYLLKDCAFEELMNAVRMVLLNRTYVSPEIAGPLLKEYANHTNSDSVQEHPALTSRERKVIQLIAEGKSTKEIATMLHVSVKTVEKHRWNIMEKLQLRSVAELTKYAIREGLTSLEK